MTTHELTLAARSGVAQIRPLADRRWDEFVRECPNASVFHTSGWLEALHRTYGYEPVAYTTAAADQAIHDALLFCRVESWLTGSRLVSLPFSDHCACLIEDAATLQSLISAVERDVVRENLDYFEMRPQLRVEPVSSLSPSRHAYRLHELDLRPQLDALFRGLHRDSTQRKIRRAEREGLRYHEGRSESLLDAFYGLLVDTRRRKGVPPQPKRWFQNLLETLGEQVKIRVASKQGQPAAAILTLRHKDTLVYKYGASDPKFHNLGAIHLLFWTCIQEAKQEGLSVFDLGRSNLTDQGLITFKDRWGSARSTLTYYRYGFSGRCPYPSNETWKEQMARRVMRRLPASVLQGVGQIFYRHVG